MVFTKAVKSKSKLRLALSGPSGSGKTYSALRLARGLVPEGKIAVLDTENGSAQLYADEFEFDVLELAPPYHPDRFIEVIQSAVEAGYDVLIMDSITHAWKGSGGILSIHQQVTKTTAKGNSFTAWNQVTPIQQRFIDAILRSKIHIICTMRAKTSYVQGEENGRKTVRKMGEAPEQRDGIEYEFTTVLDLNVNGNFAVASKDRSKLFNPEQPILITEETGVQLRGWLERGSEPAPEAWRPSPRFQQTVTKWIDNASERGAFDAAIKAAKENFSDPDEQNYMVDQLTLAKEMLENNEPDFMPDFMPDFNPVESEVVQ
ncbi:MAG: ATP-binding protein [Methyloprofundus sp.]|nr:ATP-binding protein [Methyloprofundus sp.]